MCIATLEVDGERVLGRWKDFFWTRVVNQSRRHAHSREPRTIACLMNEIQTTVMGHMYDGMYTMSEYSIYYIEYMLHVITHG